ncbi:MAG: DUF559 domain-containing protein [Pseudomonadota bacterium]
MANERARQLRNNQTDAERKLWRSLRLLESRGYHFRRQAPIDHFIADFVCFSACLIVEIDGGHHNFPDQQRSDQRREKYLRDQGFEVLRFWNNDVLRNTEGVVEAILMELSSRTPTPNPSPQGGGA